MGKASREIQQRVETATCPELVFPSAQGALPDTDLSTESQGRVTGVKGLAAYVSRQVSVSSDTEESNFHIG